MFSVFLSTSLSAVEYGYLYFSDEGATDSISLNAGDVFEVTNYESKFSLSPGYSYNVLIFSLPNGIEKYVNVKIPETSRTESSHNGYAVTDTLGSFPSGNIIVYGPTDINLGNSSVTWLSYKLTRAFEYQNSNVFSVLGDSSSTHNIVVETSTDLENWTPVHSSGLTGSSEQIYVRTRISTSE